MPRLYQSLRGVRPIPNPRSSPPRVRAPSKPLLGWTREPRDRRRETPLRDLTEQTILVTGATEGLGRLVARRLAAAGVTVLVHGRSRERCQATLEEIRTGDRQRACRLLPRGPGLSGTGALPGGTGRRRSGPAGRAGQQRGRYLPGAATRAGRPRAALRRQLPVAVLADEVVVVADGRLRAVSLFVNVASAGQSPISFDDVMLERGYGAC